MISFVFNTDSGNQQTIDVYDLKKDTYIEISNEKDSQKHYTIKDVTDLMSTGINIQTVDKQNLSTIWYDMQGRRYNHRPTQPGIYINGGKKIMIRR